LYISGTIFWEKEKKKKKKTYCGKNITAAYARPLNMPYFLNLECNIRQMHSITYWIT